LRVIVVFHLDFGTDFTKWSLKGISSVSFRKVENLN